MASLKRGRPWRSRPGSVDTEGGRSTPAPPAEQTELAWVKAARGSELPAADASAARAAKWLPPGFDPPPRRGERAFDQPREARAFARRSSQVLPPLAPAIAPPPTAPAPVAPPADLAPVAETRTNLQPRVPDVRWHLGTLARVLVLLAVFAAIEAVPLFVLHRSKCVVGQRTETHWSFVVPGVGHAPNGCHNETGATLLLDAVGLD